jgi:hypothetical protein
MRVDEWFAALDRAERKAVLAALHCCRDVAEGNIPLQRARGHLEAAWEHLRPLLQALDDDHYELKQREGDKPG